MKPDRLDQWTRVLMVLAILAVAVFAFIQSYTHLYYLGQTHHQTGAANRMFPLSVDWVMFAAGLAMLHLGRKGIKHWLPRTALAGGATATLTANIAAGIIWGWEAALIAAWAPVALFVVVELGMLLVRTAHAKAKPELSPALRPPTPDELAKIREDFERATGRKPAVMPAAQDEAVTPSPQEHLAGWQQLGGQPPAGLQGIGLKNGGR